MFQAFFFGLWRDFLKIALRYPFGMRWYARRRLREVSTDVRSGADAEHDLVRLGAPIVPVIEDRLGDRLPETRLTALRILLRIDRERALSHAPRLAADRDPRIAREARQALELRERAARGE